MKARYASPFRLPRRKAKEKCSINRPPCRVRFQNRWEQVKEGNGEWGTGNGEQGMENGAFTLDKGQAGRERRTGRKWSSGLLHSQLLHSQLLPLPVPRSLFFTLHSLVTRHPSLVRPAATGRGPPSSPFPILHSLSSLVTRHSSLIFHSSLLIFHFLPPAVSVQWKSAVDRTA